MVVVSLRTGPAAAAEPEPPQPAPPQPSSSANASPPTASLATQSLTGKPGSWAITGASQQEYRFRYSTAPSPSSGGDKVTVGDLDPNAGDEQDQDLRLLLYGGASDAHNRFAARVSMALWWDLDSAAPPGDASNLGSMYDATAPSPWFDVYGLSAEYRSPGLLHLARAGRQRTTDGPALTFDGLTLRIRPASRRLELFAFGGRTVHFFEADAALFEDWVASAGLTLRLWDTFRLVLDYRFQQEDTATQDGVQDHTYGVAARYRLSDWLHARADLRGLGDQIAHIGAGVAFDWAGLELGLNLRIDAQPTTLRQINESMDPFFAILGESQPHVRGRLDAWKAFTTKRGIYSAHVGWVGRLALSENTNRFNRSFNRLFLALDGTNIGDLGLFADLVLELHLPHGLSDGAQEYMLTAGGSAGYESGLLRAELGSAYYLTRYVYFRSVQEQLDVRTVFVALKVRPWRWLAIGARYEAELLDWTVHTARITLSEAF